MKKRIVAICTVFFLLMSFVSCSKVEKFFGKLRGGRFENDSFENGECNHSFGDWEEIKKSTCITQGERQRKCSKCKETETQKLDITEHEYINAGSITDCGSNTTFFAQICINCNHTKSSAETNSVVHPHSFVRKEPKSPTCDQLGIEVWFECQNCGYDVIEYIGSLGHILGNEIYTTSGDSTFHYRICQRKGCNQKLYEYHRYSWTLVKRSTCTTAGTMKGVCRDCGYSVTKNTSYGHQYNTGKIIKSPTCTDKGIKKLTCTVCGSTKNTDVSPLGCDFQNYKLTNNIENPCEHKGACIRCGKENYKTIHAEGEWHLTNNSSNKCEFVKECIRCDKADYKTEHCFDNGVVNKEPTCTQEGNRLYTCQRCNITKNSSISSLGHAYKEIEHLKPTCISDGFTIYQCTRCSDEKLETHNMHGHNKKYFYNETDHWRACSLCGEIFTKHTAHTLNTKIKEEVNADKTVYTYILYEYCEFCDYEKSLGQIANKHMGATIMRLESPTCTTDGYLPGLKCSVEDCGEVFIEPEPVKALGHNYIEGVCTRCGEGRVSEGLSFKLSADESYYILTGIGSCKDEHIVIPAEYENKPVKVIGENAFNFDYGGLFTYDGPKILSIIIPASVETIEHQAFCNATDLKNIWFVGNSNLKTIGIRAFYDATSLESIEIPAGVTSVGQSAFYNCKSLVEVLFAENCKLTYLSEYMFQNCTSLESILIPASIETLRCQCLDGCTNLSQVIFAEGSKLTSIGENAFYDSTGLESITIPSSVTSVGKGAFYNCKGLVEVLFAENCKLTYFSEYMFQYCTSLESIKIPASIEKLDYQAFCGCSNLTEVIFAEDSKLTSIGGNAFYDCTSLERIEIPSGVTSIGEGVFYNCKSLVEVLFDENCNITYFSKWMFRDCTSLESITIPASVVNLREQAFCGCSNLEQVIFAEDSKLKTIGEYAFYECKNLGYIEIPRSVTKISAYAFGYCSGLAHIKYLGSEDEWNAITKNDNWAYNVGECMITYQYLVYEPPTMHIAEEEQNSN